MNSVILFSPGLTDVEKMTDGWLRDEQCDTVLAPGLTDVKMTQMVAR